jgi:hypothetical protein
MKMKIIGLVSSLLFNVLMGCLIAATIGIPAFVGAGVALVVSLLLGKFMPEGSACAGVLTEVWTGELVKKMNHADMATFLDGIPDYSRYAKESVIHLVDVGGDPDVLINNTTYPIDTQALEDGDISISLDKFQTKATPVTDDELYAIAYDKISSVVERHGNALAIKQHDKAIHAFGPSENTASKPVLFTTGDIDSAGKRRMTRADIIAMKKRFDDLKVPLQGRRLVLCSDHVQDLLLTDQKFADQYYNYTTGKISNLYSFEVYEYVNNPIYTAAGVKKSFGSTASAGEFQASIAFYAPRMFKAKGETKMYYSEAKTDPLNQRNLLNFRQMFICLPKKSEAIGAIVSAYTHSVSVSALADFTKNGGTKHVTVTATGDWSVVNDDASDSWFTVEEAGNQVCVQVASNSETSAPARSGSFTVSLDSDPTVKKTIMVNQAANE